MGCCAHGGVPDNRCGRFYFQARCTCGWRGPRRWIGKVAIIYDYFDHNPAWEEAARL